jgi:hypothetical protein
MRASILALGVIAFAAGWSAAAQPALDAARGDYQSELSRQCPEKQLQLLSERDLSDGLDDYKQSLPTDIRDRLQQAERTQCSSLDAGAACVNGADISATDQAGRIADLAGSICSSFLRCRDQGVCDYAR